MATLSISKATSFHFRIETGVGTANAGAVIDGNYLYPDIATFYNCTGPDLGIQTVQDNNWPAIYNSTDGAIEFQIEYNNSAIPPIGQVYDAETDAVVAGIIMNNTTGDIWEGSVNVTTLGNGCYYILICTRGTASGPNSWRTTWGDTGTMEANINNLSQGVPTTFTIAQSGLQAEAGAFSYLKAHNAGAPTADDRLILYQSTPDEQAINSGEVWEIKCFVYLLNAAPLLAAGFISWAVTNSDGFGTAAGVAKGWIDATVISQVVYLQGGSPEDAWVEVSAIFQVNTDTGGYFRLEANATPLSGGDIFVDTITWRKVTNSVCEARSETFYVDTNHDCSTLITYTNDDNAFEIEYETGNIIHSIRVIYDGLFKFSMLDNDYLSEDESDGTVTVKVAFPQKVYTVVFGALTEAMAEKLILASKHDTFELDGLRLVPTEGGIEPEWKEETGYCTVTMQLRLQDYNYQNSNC